MAPPALLDDGNLTFESPRKATMNGHLHGQQDTVEQEKSVLLHRSMHAEPLKVLASSGNYLYLSNGQAIFDASGGAAVACLGHGNERVKQAVQKQMDVVSYCHSLFYSTDAAEELAKELINSTQGRMAHAYIVGSGSEAVDAAIKLSRQYFLEKKPAQPKRTKFISRHHSYHGATIGALSVGGHVARRAPFEPLLHNISARVSPCNAYRGLLDGETMDEYVAMLAQELDEEFQRLGPDTVCAFFAEPIVGAALGCVPSVTGYFQAMKAVCDKHGALLILDEIMCGMGRTGTMHAWEQEGIVPDIQTIGKGLGGGYAPVAGLLIHPRVTKVLADGTGAFMHGQTYQGHPISCAAALEVQRIIREEDLLQNVKVMGNLMESLLRKELSGHQHVGDIRGRGLFWGIEFVRNKATKEPFDPSEGIALALHEKGMKPEFGISLYPGTGTVDGRRGDHIILAPAYNITRDEVELVVGLTARLINSFFAERKCRW